MLAAKELLHTDELDFWIIQFEQLSIDEFPTTVFGLHEARRLIDVHSPYGENSRMKLLEELQDCSRYLLTYTEEGDDSFFSVWTTTEPGYFLPELVAAGQVRAEDLVFGFSVPRSVAPAHVYRQMLAAAKYAQERLGGVLLSDDGELLDEANALAEIEDTVAILLDAGIDPGSEVALRLF